MSAKVSQSLNKGTKQLVAVKGTKSGLLFLFDDNCDFNSLSTYLEDLLHGDLSTIFDGPEVQITVDYGHRKWTAEQSHILLAMFMEHRNFVISEWGHQGTARKSFSQGHANLPAQSIYKGSVRSGQRIAYDGDVVVIGDVHPGGEIVATGDIYVFGKLSGIAHAGAAGNVRAVIGAARFAPLQLRIADVASHAPSVSGKQMETFMEFAYLLDNGMAVDKLQFLPSLRPHQS